ncbi:MAG: hypothetical protein JSU92_03430, partial [Deltaproteobacteria bacterium]
PDCTDPVAPAAIGSDMTLRCIECDACGNLGAETARNYTIDTVANVTITFPVDGETVLSGDVTVSGTVDGSDITTVTVTSDQGHSESSLVVGGNWSVTLLSVAVPSITITATSTDSCGNIGSHSITVPVEVFAVVVGVPSGPQTNAITISTGSVFDVMIYGSVMADTECGVISATMSLGSYEFTIQYDDTLMTINSATADGNAWFDDDIGGTFSSDISVPTLTWIQGTNDGGDPPLHNNFSQPMGQDIPLAILNFTANAVGNTTIFVDAIGIYESNDLRALCSDLAYTRSLTVEIK